MKSRIIYLILFFATATLNAQYVEQCQPFDGTNATGICYQGFAVAISADGSTAATTFIDGENEAGGCAIFKFTGGQWVQQSIIRVVAPGINWLNMSLALSADGSTLAFCWDSAHLYQYSGGVWSLQATLPFHSGGQGAAVSYDGNTALVDNAVYVRFNNTWNLQATLRSADSSFGNWFSGNCVISADGNVAALSSWYSPDSSTNVWVFKRTGTSWQQQGNRLEGTGSTVHVYNGWWNPNLARIAISGDGNTIALGNDNDSTASNGLWVFTLQNGVWVEQYNASLSNPFALNFYPAVQGIDNTGGMCPQLSYNGNRLIASDALGVGFVYWQRTGSTWANTGTICNYNAMSYYDSLSIYFSSPSGFAMDSGGTRIMATRYQYEGDVGSAWFYTLTGSSWTQSGPSLSITGLKPGNSWQGTPIVISRDGNTMAESGISDNGKGAVWLFKRTGSTWQQMGQKLSLPSWQPANFGNALSISADGSVLAIGASKANITGPASNYWWNAPGVVYIYKRNGAIYTLRDSIVTHSPEYFFGSAVSISDDGNTLLVLSGPSNLSGSSVPVAAAQVFTYNGSTWAFQDTLMTSAGSLTTGILSGDGNTAVIGEPYADNYKGYIYIYNRTGSTWSLQAGPLQPPGLMQNDYFPTSLALSQNGNSLFAGCPYADSIYGAVYWFSRTGANWNFNGSLIDSSHVPLYNNNYDLAYNNGQTLAVSAYGDTLIEAPISGGLMDLFFVYAYQGGQWQLLPSLKTAKSDDGLPYVGASIRSMGLSGDAKYLAVGIDSLRMFVLSGMYDSTLTLQAATCPQSTNGKIKVLMTGGTPPYHFAWANGSPDTDSSVSLAPGVYSVTITDANGDTLQRAYTIGVVNNLRTSAYNTTYNCNTGTGSICLHIRGGTAPYAYTWQTAPVQNTDSATALPPGSYVYSVTDAHGCLLTDSASLSASSVWGNVTGTNPGCQLPGYAAVTIYGGTIPYSYAWNNGAVAATDSPLLPGNYTATAADANGCSVRGGVTLNTWCGYAISGTVFYDKNNNCIQEVGELPGAGYTMQAVGGGITAFGNTDASGNYNILLPGPGTYTISIAQWHECNYPLCTDSLSPIHITIDSNITTGNVNFPLVNAGVDLTMQVSSYYPYPGSSFNYTIYYGNLQDSVIPSGSLTLAYDSNLVFNSATPQYASLDIANHIVTWNLSAIGLLYPLNNQKVSVNVTLPATILPRTILKMSSTIQPTTGDCNPENNFLTVPILVLGSLDPNFKMAFPQNELAYGDTAITYTIHFQNTGTDSTHFIQVLDTLPANLNPASVVTLATSYVPYSFNISKGGILSWSFNPDILPDSSQNRQQSQGFVTFRVNTMGVLSPGAAINNQASIYFDYNQPVVTNTTNNIVVDSITGIKPLSDKLWMDVFPNPASGYVNIKTATGALGNTLEVTDVAGRLLQRVEITNGTMQLNTYPLADGCYFVKLVNGAVIQATKKFMVAR